MANVFLNIPVPAANGAGAPVDVSAMGRTKSFVIGGNFQATVNVEYSTDAGGVVWAPLATFLQSGNLTIDVAAMWLRAVVTDYKGGIGNLDVGSSDAGTVFVILPGAGTPVDISTTPLLKTVVSSGPGNIEVSEDGISWAQIFSLPGPGGVTREVYGQFARVQPGGSTVTLAAANENGSGGGGVPVFDPTRVSFFEDYINSGNLLVAPFAGNTSFQIVTLPTNIDPTYKSGLAEYLIQTPSLPGDSVETNQFFTTGGPPPEARASVEFSGCGMELTIRGSIAVPLSPTDDVTYWMGGDYGINAWPAGNGGSTNWFGVVGTQSSRVDLGVAVDALPHTFKLVYTVADDTMRYYIDGILRATVVSPGIFLFSKYNRIERVGTDTTMAMYVDYDLLELTGLPR